MSLDRLLIVLSVILVVGCSNDRDSDSDANLPLASLPGVYDGEFPCDGCPGVPSTLWLRSDGRFFFKQRYVENDARDAVDAYGLGRWRSIPDNRTFELTGAGPKRIFTRVDADTLIMQTDSELEHRLTRDPTAADFSATIRMVGKMRMRGGSAWFTECLTGFEAPVRKGGDYARFRHQYQSAAERNKPTYVELDGRFSWASDGALKSMTIERFITVKANGGC